MTEHEILRAAFAALLRGDTAERDRLIALARATQAGARAQQPNAKPIPLVRQPDGSYVAATLLR